MKSSFTTVVIAAILLSLSCTDASKNADAIVPVLKEGIISRAEGNLSVKPVTITSFIAEESEGGIHDFFSQADYSWPDPANPDGPFIGRDGYSYPGLYGLHRKALNDMSIIVANLTSAWILTGDRKYADAVLPHLYAWFINEDTRMNPRLDYAQAVHGKSNGRSWGLIDTIHLTEVAQSMIRLEEAGLMPDDLLAGTKQWFHDYVDWLTSDPKGVAEWHAGNNHGVCWAMQVGAFAKYCGWTEMVEFCKIRYKYKFLPEMAPDGSFPMELARTKSYGYSLFQLDAMCGVCQVLSTPEDDLWAYTAENGNNIRMALDFMFPYIKDKSGWMKEPDVMYWDEWPVAHPSLIFAWNRFKNEKDFNAQEYFDTWEKLEHFPENKEVIRNLPLRNPVLWLM